MPDDLDDTTSDDDDTVVTDADDDTTATGGKTAGDDKGKTDDKPAAKDTAKANAPKIEGDFDADRAARLIERLRNESRTEKEARQAAETKSADTLKAIQKALGMDVDDKPDPEALTRQLEEARDAERQRRTENLVLRVAPGLGADPDVLLDSTAFLKAIADHGPDARDDVEDTIRDFLKKSDRYKLPTAATAKDGDTADDGGKKEPKKPAGRSGADMNGSAAKPRQWTQAELDAAMQARKFSDIDKAREAGLLDTLMNS